ncbi:60S ribosomal protein like [Actinidia chinensis var. chinensis]|uniref:60S ribosomal protein like n=1 Tax=Actinidia chinensis var. chinensis TaxID=1590841 RepID=A0A2R6QAE7_ACTCC|nr:60S ribosomal protein like [Actinidia chinensis var. chinensis]
MPNIGYGSDKTQHYLPNGYEKFVVNNVKELEVLMMHNRDRTQCVDKEEEGDSGAGCSP